MVCSIVQDKAELRVTTGVPMATRRGTGEGTLFKNKQGYWVGGIELPPGPDGKRRTKRVKRKDRNEAIAALRQIKKDYDTGNLALAKSTTVAKWLDYWYTDILPRRTVRGAGVKPATTISYRNTIKNYLNPYIGAKRMDKLTPADIRTLYTKLEKDVSTRAAQKADQVLRLAFKAAVRDSVVTASVMEKVDKPAHQPKPQQAFGAKVAALIIATAIEAQGDMWGARWALGFTSGARESEILGLEWDRVDLDAGTIDISWQLKREQQVHGCGGTCGKVRVSFCPEASWQFPPWMEWRPCAGTMVWTKPKTHAGVRLVPLIPDMVAVLRRLYDRVPNPYNLVFHHPDGMPFSQEQDQRQWKALLKAAGLPHVPQHSVRHSTATLLMEYGASEHIISSVIGHTDITTTRKYQHVDLSLAQTAWGNLAAILPPT